MFYFRSCIVSKFSKLAKKRLLGTTWTTKIYQVIPSAAFNNWELWRLGNQILPRAQMLMVKDPSPALSILDNRKTSATDMMLTNLLTNTSPNLPPRAIH